MIAAGGLDPAGRGAQLHNDQDTAQAKRARPTWVTRTPTPPLAIRFPNTPPITPAQAGLIATYTAVRTNHTFDSEAPSISQEQPVELEGHYADDEMSENEDVRDEAEGEGAGEPSDHVLSPRTVSQSPGDQSDPGTEMEAGGGTTEGVEGLDTSTSCADHTIQAQIVHVECIATHHESSVAPSELYESTNDQLPSGCPAETSAAHVEENVEGERSDEEAEESGTTDAENDVEDMIDDIAGRGTDKDRAMSPYSPAGATDSSSIGRAMTEEAGMEWEEASCGYRLPGAQRLKTT